MLKPEFLSDEFQVRWDEALNSLLLVHPKHPEPPMVRIRAETLSRMSFAAASQFIGERLVLLMPGLRQRYVDDSVSPSKLRPLSLTERPGGTPRRRLAARRKR